MTEPCRTCRHFHRPPGDDPVGWCDLGGPNPGDGCADTRADESCDEWEPRESVHWLLDFVKKHPAKGDA